MSRESRRRRHRRRVAHHRAAKRSWTPYRAYPGRLSRVLAVVVGLVMGPLMYLGETEQTGFQFDPVLAAFAVGIVAMCTRWGQLGIYISPAGVTVRNFFRSHHLSWGEVEEFWLHDHGLSVRTKDDVIHPTCYFSRYPINPVVMDLQYRPLHRKLQAELRAAREAAQPGLRREPSSLPEN